MAKLKSKGTTLSLSIESVYTPITQLTSLGIEGADPETFDGRTLDQADNWIPNLPTGYVASGNANFEGFYDPQLESHQAVMAANATPVVESWQLEYSDGTTQDFDSAGVGVSVTADPADGLRFSGTLPIAGDPGFTAIGSGTGT